MEGGGEVSGGGGRQGWEGDEKRKEGGRKGEREIGGRSDV